MAKRASYIDLVNQVAKETDTTQKDARNFCSVLFQAIKDTDGTLTIPNFGLFKKADRKARVGRNPHTDEPVNIPARVALVFKESKEG